MSKLFPIFLLIFTVFLVGCNSIPSSDGGNSNIKYEKWTFHYDDEPEPVEIISEPEIIINPEDQEIFIPEIPVPPASEIKQPSKITYEKIEAALEQPENPKGDATLSFRQDENNNPVIETEISGSSDIAKTALDSANFFKSTRNLQLIGVGIMLVGGLILGLSAWLQKRMIWWPFIIIGLGLTLTIVASLLIKYAWVFLLLIIIMFVLFIGYLIFKFLTHSRSNEENISIIQYIKDKYLSQEEQEELFKSDNGFVNKTQSKSTKKIVDKVKKNK